MHQTRVAKYVTQKLIELKEETDISTIIIGVFNTPLSAIDRTNKQKISKDIKQFNTTTDQQALINIYRALHPTKTEFHSFQVSMECTPKTEHILGHEHKKPQQI